MDGLLLVDKPKGPTSHDIVDFIRKRFRIKKVGHTGTLDPNATGLLILLIGSFTKFARHLISLKKDYEATLLLGLTTDTQDIQGKTIKKEQIRKIDVSEIREVFNNFKGKSLQLPPMVSAKRIAGKRLYELSRQGKVIEREPVEIEIYDIKTNDIRLPEIDFFVSCSKGTYVRTLCDDIGDILECGGCLKDLRRVAIGDYNISNAISLEELKEMDKVALQNHILKPKL